MKKRKYLKLFFFLAPLLVILIVGELMVRNIPNDYSYKHEYLLNNSDSIETLILGGSHTHAGVDPEHMSTPSFNAAHNAQSLYYDFEILKKYDFENLNTVILPISYPTFWLDYQKGEGFLKEQSRNYTLYYKINPENYTLKNSFETLSFSPKGNLGRVYRYYFKGKSRRVTSDLGYGGQSIIKGELSSEGKKSSDRHTGFARTKNANSIFKKNKRILSDLIDYCDQRNIKVYLITTPTHSHYFKLLDSQQLETTTNTITEMVDRYDNCEYFNYLKDDRFLDQHYTNADHLNPDGAIKFTEIIEGQISQKSLE